MPQVRFNLKTRERLNDTRFLQAHRSAVYDASRALRRGPCDLRAHETLESIEKLLRATLLPALQTEPPSRLAYFFDNTSEEWRSVLRHISHRTLKPGSVEGTPSDQSLGHAVSDQEVVVALQILTLVFLLHPPSILWHPSYNMVSCILLAKGSDTQCKMRTKNSSDRLRLKIMDCILAFCFARIRVKSYRGISEAGGDMPGTLGAVLSRVFASLPDRSRYQLDQSNVFGAVEKEKQRDNIQALLAAFGTLTHELSKHLNVR